jgi:hypothetical protein
MMSNVCTTITFVNLNQQTTLHLEL